MANVLSIATPGPILGPECKNGFSKLCYNSPLLMTMIKKRPPFGYLVRHWGKAGCWLCQIPSQNKSSIMMSEEIFPKRTRSGITQEQN